MNDKLFDELLESIRQGGAIVRGDAAPSRTFSLDDPDVAAIRAEYGLSQDKFASLLGISVRTLQNWEQGRRQPHGPAKVLLRVASRHPKALLEAVSSEY
ncbi:MAG: helix-turn-helix domain-containing protein [Rhodothermales bacterium]